MTASGDAAAAVAFSLYTTSASFASSLYASLHWTDSWTHGSKKSEIGPRMCSRRPLRYCATRYCDWSAVCLSRKRTCENQRRTRCGPSIFLRSPLMFQMAAHSPSLTVRLPIHTER